MIGHTRQDRIKSDIIRKKVTGVPIVGKLTYSCSRWFGHLWKRSIEAPSLLSKSQIIKRGLELHDLFFYVIHETLCRHVI